VTSRLEIDSNGWVKGIAHHPSPNVASGMSVPASVLGVVMHTMVGNLPGTDSEFLNSNAQVSAHFGIGQDGTVIQWVDVLGGVDVAWAEMAGNPNWYSIEHADDGNPLNPLTPQQITASAQVVELLSRVGNFPLQEANSPSQEGYGVHYMGGAGWGGHTCPDIGPSHPVRSLQRPLILATAKAIRAGAPVPGSVRPWTTKGMLTLHALASTLGTTVDAVLRLTAQNSPGGTLPPVLADYIDGVFAADTTHYPSSEIWFWHSGVATFRPTAGQLSLNDLCTSLGVTVATTLELTVRHNTGQAFAPVQAAYVNGVFAASEAHVPAGSVVWY
jgi:N-acetylmuramoyl-L-alanine amidase-like protein